MTDGECRRRLPVVGKALLAPPNAYGRRRSPVVALVVAALLGASGALTACRSPQPEGTGSGEASPAAVSTRIPTEAEKSARTLLARPRTAGVWPGSNGLSGVNGDPVLDTA